MRLKPLIFVKAQGNSNPAVSYTMAVSLKQYMREHNM